MKNSIGIEIKSNRAWREEAEGVRKQLATVTKERDELVAALEIAKVGMCAVGVPHAGERKVLQDAVNVVRAALAKLGADKEET